jgi:hypothetical protein
LNDGQIQNPSKPFGLVPLSNFVPRGFGFVHHSIAILYHEVSTLISRFATFSSQYAAEIFWGWFGFNVNSKGSSNKATVLSGLIESQTKLLLDLKPVAWHEP